MPKHVHLSARVDPTTKELLDRYVRSKGVKKGHVLEEALRHHLQALQALPSDVIVHPVLVLTGESGERECLPGANRTGRQLHRPDELDHG